LVVGVVPVVLVDPVALVVAPGVVVVVAPVVVVAGAGVVDVVDEEGGAGVVVDDVPVETPVPVDGGPVGLTTRRALSVFVRAVPMDRTERFGCFVAAGTAWEIAVEPRLIAGRAPAR
jgi:hypothetical protein